MRFSVSHLERCAECDRVDMPDKPDTPDMPCKPDIPDMLGKPDIPDTPDRQKNAYKYSTLLTLAQARSYFVI